MTKRITILCLHPWTKWIGPHRYLFDIVSQLVGHDIDFIIALHEKNDAAMEFERLGCRIVIWPEVMQWRASLAGDILLQNISNITLGVRRLLPLVRQLSPSMILSNSEQIFIGSILAHRLGVPHVKIFHAMTFLYRLGGHPRLMQYFLSLLAAGSDKIIAVSETLRNALVKGGLNDDIVETVPNPMNISKIHHAAEAGLPKDIEEKLSGKYPIIVSAGVIFPKKGHDQLIEALPGIKKKYSKCLALIAGDIGDDSGVEKTADYFTSLKSRVFDLGLFENVIFTGAIDYLPALMRRADVYVQTSKTESFCRTVAEAILCGTPVVAYQTDAIPEVVGPGAVLVPPDDITGLVRSIIAAIEKREQMRTMVLQGAAHIEERFESSLVARRFLEVIEKVLFERGENRP
ncbi:MAG: glycosyltransferase family 4 protein [Smithella sp.]|nr:glycosyltransferase family 4 protein [Smithella sp.]